MPTQFKQGPDEIQYKGYTIYVALSWLDNGELCHKFWTDKPKLEIKTKAHGPGIETIKQ